MKQLPKDLASRLENIFSQKEMSHLKTVFSLEKRAVSFRINTLTSASQEIEEALDQASLSYTKLNFPNNSYVLSDTHRESDIWKRRVYKD